MHAIINPGEISEILEKLDMLEKDVMKESDLCERKHSRQVSGELSGQYLNLRKLLEETLTPQIEEMVTGLNGTYCYLPRKLLILSRCAVLNLR